MNPKNFCKGVYSVGSLDRERKFFDELMPLEYGTSYNSYVVVGEDKIALIDSVDPTKRDELLGNLNALGIEQLDYVVCNHAEQDHSGSIPFVLEAFPTAKVVANAKCKEMLQDLMQIPDSKFLVVADRQALPLGGKTLQFFLTPWVHWPETMITFLKEDKVLFSCDFFGSHLGTNVFASQEQRTMEFAKLYYGEIMMPFKAMVAKHLALVKELQPKIIAPSHGPIYDQPEKILAAYEDWISPRVAKKAVIAFVSMHGSTRKAVMHLARSLEKKEVDVRLFDLGECAPAAMAGELVDAATLVVASPTVLGGLHPNAVLGALLASALKPKTRFLALISSFGWAAVNTEQTKTLFSGLKAEFLLPVLFKGEPKENDLRALDALAELIAEKHSKI